MRRVLAIILALGAGACEEVGPPEFTEPLTLGERTVDVATLNRGRRGYNSYCRSCHGPLGDGQGPLGVHQDPPARDLRKGIIKFAAVPSGSLPRDEDLARVITGGLRGTSMLPWRVPEGEVDAVVQYVKSFSERWRGGETPEAPVEVSPDPWSGRLADAAERGRALFYGEAKCVSCHPAHDPPAGAELREDAEVGKLTESVFGEIRATDLESGTLRNGDEPEDLYRIIAAGVGGTAMPTWKGMLPEADLWALVHYVRSLRGE